MRRAKLRCLTASAGLVTIAAIFGGCAVKGPIRVEQTTQPIFANVIDGHRALRVAVMTPTMRGNLGGQSAAHWAQHAKADLENALVMAARRNGQEIILVRTQDDGLEILNEQDMERAGLVSSGGARSGGTLQGWDVMINGDMMISVTEVQGQKTEIRVGQGSIAGVPVALGKRCTKTRTTFVDATLRVVNRGGENIVPFKTDLDPILSEEESNIILPGEGLNSLVPVDQDIARALRSFAPQFAGLFFAMDESVAIEIESSSKELSKQGVSMLLAAGSDPARIESAVALLEQAVAVEPCDHKSLFALGAAHEKLGRSGDALRYYNMASDARGKKWNTANSRHLKKMREDKYVQAVRRAERYAGTERLAGPVRRTPPVLAPAPEPQYTPAPYDGAPIRVADKSPRLDGTN